MRVIICGAGQVGYGIAERLSAEGNEITVIDNNAALVQRVRDTLDARGLHGHGSHPDVLAQAGARDADMLIAVTQVDEVNMTACQVAHSIFEVPTRIARIRSQTYLAPEWSNLFSRDHLPIDVIISPEVEVGDLILQRMAYPGANEIVTFEDEKVVVIEVDVREDCAVIDTPLKHLTDLFPNLNATVMGVRRDGEMRVMHSHEHMIAGDQAVVAVARDQVSRILGLFGRDEAPPSRIVIAGAGNVGRYVARRIEELDPGVSVRIVESNRDNAQRAAEALNHSIVVFGDALQGDILREVDVRDAHMFLGLTNDDKTNILTSVLASEMGCRANIALVNQSQYPRIAQRLGVDAFINPRAITVSKVLRHVRRGRIRGVYTLANGAAELLEAEALETSTLVGKPLRDFNFPEGIRIGAIIRGDEVLMPSGDVTVQAGDFVIVFALAESLRQVERMFRVSIDFF
ncbi:Trk system potassium transporter TrkA [Pelagibacterium xiamenense]|uniref:Trk system potassium transporter TrkA n=1 Tax=Pelagibacterium xiamenense TaxID=2901140 RepID=UPI001E448FC9|nr:Trk system potassium transporter TrkA [Pelagibacterium xiamenense]MCD7060999.1 Trk system potassium transporter TrkA [Pelagibacterium xiamenense]